MLLPPRGAAAGRLAAVLPDPVPRAADALGDLLRKLAEGGGLDLPAPAGGRTRERWSALTALGRADLVLGRLAEGHADAAAILADAGREREPGTWGVWASASGGTGLTAYRAGAGWRLDGLLRYCSGARLVDHALVTGTAPGEDGVRLFAVDLTDPGLTPVPGTWPAVGMDASDSLDVEATGAVGRPVGGPGWYAARPGFAVGGIGVAAVWLGGALGVLDDVLRTLRADPDPHALAHVGACAVALAAADALLDRAAADVDADPAGGHRPLALTVRAAVEDAAQTVLRRAGRVTGATPLCRDAVHAHRVADLHVYVRQQHAERDLAALGNAVVTGARTDGPRADARRADGGRINGGHADGARMNGGRADGARTDSGRTDSGRTDSGRG